MVEFEVFEDHTTVAGAFGFFGDTFLALEEFFGWESGIVVGVGLGLVVLGPGNGRDLIVLNLHAAQALELFRLIELTVPAPICALLTLEVCVRIKSLLGENSLRTLGHALRIVKVFVVHASTLRAGGAGVCFA